MLLVTVDFGGSHKAVSQCLFVCQTVTFKLRGYSIINPDLDS